MKKKLPKCFVEQENKLQEKAKSISLAKVFTFLIDHGPYESPLFAIFIDDKFYGEFDYCAADDFIDRIVRKGKVCPLGVYKRRKEMIRSSYFRSISK